MKQPFQQSMKDRLGLGSRQRRCPTASMTFPDWLAWVPPSGCLVSQPPRLLATPEPRQDAGEREILPCLWVSVAHAPAGGRGSSGHTIGWRLARLVGGGGLRQWVTPAGGVWPWALGNEGGGGGGLCHASPTNVTRCSSPLTAPCQSIFFFKHLACAEQQIGSRVAQSLHQWYSIVT